MEKPKWKYDSITGFYVCLSANMDICNGIAGGYTLRIHLEDPHKVNIVGTFKKLSSAKTVANLLING